MNINRSYIVLFVLLFISVSCNAVEIVLDKSSAYKNGGQKAINIGFADIEMLFNEHPLTLRHKKEFQAEVEKRKKDMDETDKNIDDIQNIIISSTTQINNSRKALEVLKLTSAGFSELKKDLTQDSTTFSASEINNESVTVSSMSVVNAIRFAGEEAAIAQREKNVEVLKEELEEVKTSLKIKLDIHKKELLKLENDHSSEVMNDLYKVIEKLSKDEDITIIIDKNDVLYGQYDQDLTGKIKERLQGR